MIMIIIRQTNLVILYFLYLLKCGIFLFFLAAYRKCQPDDIHCGPAEGGHSVSTKPTDLCVPKEKKCDGYLDCRSGRDEQDCTGLACRLDQFRCATGNKCIDASAKCNHKDECGDNSDEHNCNFPACHAGQFRCANAVCIPANFHCDGYKDCADESDEVNCTAIACPDNKFLCPKGGPNGAPKCITKQQLCDGKSDCADGTDEVTACCKYIFNEFSNLFFVKTL